MRRARILELSRAATSPASRPCLRGQRRCSGAAVAELGAPGPRLRRCRPAHARPGGRGCRDAAADAPRTKMAAPRASAAHVSAAPHKDGRARRAPRPRPTTRRGSCPQQRWRARSPDGAGFPHVVAAPPARQRPLLPLPEADPAGLRAAPGPERRELPVPRCSADR